MLRYRSTAVLITFNLVVACVLATATASAQDINTIAGTGAAGFTGDGGPALAATLHQPGEIAVAPDGTIFFVDPGNVRIRRIRPSGIIDTVAGSGRIGPGGGDGGPATEADFGDIFGIAVDATRNSLYVSDSDNSRVRRIDLATGIISTFAGTGVFGYTGDGGAAKDAALAYPLGLTVDDVGNLFVVDQFNCRVRRIDAATGIITTVAGYVDHTGFSFCDPNFNNHGGEAPGALDAPLRVAVDRDNNLYVLCFRIPTPVLLRIDRATRLYTTVFEFPEDPTAASLTVRSDGHLFVASDTRIFEVDPDGTGPVVVAGSLVSGFAGDGGPAVNALFSWIAGLAFTPSGALLVSDSGNNRIRAIGPPPGVWTGDLTVVGTNQTNITLSGVTTVTGSINISNNPTAEEIDLAEVTSVGGDVTVASNTGVSSIDLGSLTTAAGVTIAGNTAAGSIDLGSLTTAAGVTIAGNTAAGSIDLGSLTTTAGVTIAGNAAAGSIVLAELTSVGGDLIIDNNGACTNVVAGSVTSVMGNVDVESCGTGSFTIGSAAAGGSTTIATTGYTLVTGTTAAGSTTVSNMTGDARMTVVVQTGSFVTPVTFAVTRLEPLTLLPEIGLTPTGSDVMLDPIAAYEITFEVPVLNRDAALTFDVYLAGLDAATRDAFLAALAIGEATIATRNDAGSQYQTFPICGELESPSAGGCVRLEMLDGNGQPTASAPALVRFSNVVGHFSTWAVVIPTAEDATPPTVTPIISGTLGANGWYVGDVTITWDFQDSESPIGSTSGCDSAVVTSDTVGTSFTCTATSRGGTTSESVVITLDKTPPTIACAAPDGLWHNTDVAVGCTADGGVSGLVNAADANFTLVTSVPANTEDANAGTNSRTIYDAAGNSAVAGPVAGNRVDKKAPTITMTSPATTTYLLNQSVAANYTCADGGSGIASCAGPANGANVTTSVPGANRFTVNASDRVGNATQATIDYQVQYQPAGTMCDGAPGHQILQPIRADGSSVFRQRSTVPVKFRVCDANGLSIGTAGVVSGFHLVAKIVGTVTTTIDEDVTSSTPDTAFRWDAGERLWIFNISNDNLEANATYVYRIVLSDGTSVEFRYGLR